MQERVDTGVGNEGIHGRQIQDFSEGCDKCRPRIRRKRTGVASRRDGTRRKWGGELLPRRALCQRHNRRVQAKISKRSPSDLCSCRGDYKDGEGLQGKTGA